MENMVAEFLGTTLLILLGNGVVANVVLSKTKGERSGWIVITTGWGTAVFVAVLCVGDISARPNVLGFEKQLSWVKMKNKLIKFIPIWQTLPDVFLRGRYGERKIKIS